MRLYPVLIVINHEIMRVTVVLIFTMLKSCTLNSNEIKTYNIK